MGFRAQGQGLMVPVKGLGLQGSYGLGVYGLRLGCLPCCRRSLLIMGSVS